MINLNLHYLSIPVNDGPDQSLENYSTKLSFLHIDTAEVIFRNQESRLLKIIKVFENAIELI